VDDLLFQNRSWEFLFLPKVLKGPNRRLSFDANGSRKDPAAMAKDRDYPD
jgi:hypothetical protein